MGNEEEMMNPRMGQRGGQEVLIKNSFLPDFGLI